MVLSLGIAANSSAAKNQAVLYDGYGSGAQSLITGRVIEAEQRTAAKERDAWYKNLLRSMRILKNSEREDVKLEITIGQLRAQAVSDAEGYISLNLTPQSPLTPGWHTVSVHGKNTRGTGRLLIVPSTNTLGVISDIDDTVLVSDVVDKTTLLKNTFLKNPKQRLTFPGTANFYQRLLAQNAAPKSAPMFYVSASPRQLTEPITAFLAQNHYPPGVLLTKQISGQGYDPLLDQKAYKSAKIAAIFKALPWVKFTLVGDDGELDPEIYQALQEKYPQHVAAIYIRKVHPDPKRKAYPGQLDLATASAR